MASGELRVTIGHGTENDFVLVADPDGALDLTDELVARLCHRRTGIGGDGLIRAVRSRALPDGAAALDQDPSAEWFMDYRNADGSVAEMCGNGVRVVVALLLRDGLLDAEELDSERGLALGTRGGVKRVRRALGPSGETDWFTVDMGLWRLPGGESARVDGHDALVRVPGLDGVPRPALTVDTANPHTVVALAALSELRAADLSQAPAVDPSPPRGSNVELVVIGPPVPDEHGGEMGRLRMRVHERGSGETRSCGTGACAAAIAASSWGGPGSPTTWLVEVPGGLLRVVLPGGREVELAGPARLVADAVVQLDALA